MIPFESDDEVEVARKVMEPIKEFYSDLLHTLVGLALTCTAMVCLTAIACTWMLR
jgi:hypothetical protein